MLRGELVGLSFVFWAVVGVQQNPMPDLMCQHKSLLPRPEPVADQDLAVLRHPQAVRRPEPPHDNRYTELFGVLPGVVLSPPREPQVRLPGALDRR